MGIERRGAVGWLAACLVVLALAIALRDSLGALGHQLTSVSPLGLGLLVVPGALMMLVTGLSFSYLVLPALRVQSQRGAIVSIYLVAQMVKYLPGRIWGFVYQLRRLSDWVHPGQGLIASLNHQVVTLHMSVLFLGVAMAVPGAWLIWTGGVLLGLAWIHRGGVAAYLAWVRQLPPSTFVRLPVQAVLGFGMSLLFEWLFYFAVWAGLFMLLDLPAGMDVVIAAAAFYAGAWIFGSVLGVLPGGLGAREGGFILLGAGLPVSQADLMALALLARLVFTLAETLAGTLAAVHMRKVTTGI